jgi:outer membrane protein OmpA-like peptidoglycan-associated protein
LERAQSIVAGVEGVRVVSAYVLPSQTIVVTISGGDISADGPIPNDLLLIAQALSGPGSAVIELRDGRITLSGRVTPFAQEAAVSAAGELVGESNVVDQLEMLPPPPPLGGPEGLQRELNQLPPITFDNNKATLTVAGQASVAKAAELLRRMPLGKVRIEGHTDTNGSAEANLVLSQARARTVLNALVLLGIKSDRLIAIGRGEAQPKVPDTSPENRAINRRVEFVAEPPPPR